MSHLNVFCLFVWFCFFTVSQQPCDSVKSFEVIMQLDEHLAPLEEIHLWLYWWLCLMCVSERDPIFVWICSDTWQNISHGFTGSKHGLNVAPAGSDLLVSRHLPGGQQGFKGETGSVSLPSSRWPAVPDSCSEGRMQSGCSVKWAHNSTCGKTPSSGNKEK